MIRPNPAQATAASLAAGAAGVGGITRVELLGHGGALEFTQDAAGLKVTMPAEGARQNSSFGRGVPPGRPDASARRPYHVYEEFCPAPARGQARRLRLRAPGHRTETPASERRKMAYKRACASGKAALARAHSKTCRQVGSALGTRSVLECGTQFRFGRASVAVGGFEEIYLTRPLLCGSDNGLDLDCQTIQHGRGWFAAKPAAPCAKSTIIYDCAGPLLCHLLKRSFGVWQPGLLR